MAEWDDKRNYEDEFEQELRAGLRPHPAPTGFADRVVARAQELQTSSASAFSIRRRGLPPMLRWGMAAVLLLTVTVGSYLQHQREQRIAGERARQQVLLALRITRTTLQAVQNRVDNDRDN